MANQHKRRVSHRDRKSRRSSRHYKYLDGEDTKEEETRNKELKQKKDQKGNFSGLSCVHLNYRIDEAALPPIEDKVADTIIYNSFVECGEEMKEETEKITTNISKSFKESKESLQEYGDALRSLEQIEMMKKIQAKVQIARNSCSPSHFNDLQKASSKDRFTSESPHIISLFPRPNDENKCEKHEMKEEGKSAKAFEKKSLQSEGKNMSNEEKETKISNSFCEFTPVEYTGGSILSVRSSAPFHQSAREARRKFNLFIRNRSQEVKMQASKQSRRIDSNWYPDVTPKDPPATAKQIHQLYPKEPSSSIRKEDENLQEHKTHPAKNCSRNSEAVKVTNTAHESNKPKTRKDTAELLHMIGTAMPLIRKQEEFPKTTQNGSIVNVDDMFASCQYSPFSLFTSSNKLMQFENGDSNVELDDHTMHSLEIGKGKCKAMDPPEGPKNVSKMRERIASNTSKSASALLDEEMKIENQSIRTSSGKLPLVIQREQQQALVRELSNTDAKENVFEENDDMANKKVTFSPETYNYSSDVLTNPAMRSLKKTRMRRLTGFVEI